MMATDYCEYLIAAKAALKDCEQFAAEHKWLEAYNAADVAEIAARILRRKLSYQTIDKATRKE